jgi:hypothetical protein
MSFVAADRAATCGSFGNSSGHSNFIIRPQDAVSATTS